jgi:L-fuconolactonase
VVVPIKIFTAVATQMKQGPREVTDCHHHLWRWRDIEHGEVISSPEMSRDYLWSDFVAAWAGQPMQSSVLVQVRSSLAEVAFVETIAKQNDQLRAMIAWAPLERTDAPRIIEQLRQHPLVRGVRRNAYRELDPLFCARNNYVAAVRLLGEFGYLCEICIRPEQFDGAIALATACPETKIVLEHFGKPEVSGPPAPVWLRGIDRLASLPNVACKVSVVVHGAADSRYETETLAPYVLQIVEAFGWERIMFGSNWPISTEVVSYSEWIRMLLEILGWATPDDLAKFFSGNAQSLYARD